MTTEQQGLPLAGLPFTPYERRQLGDPISAGTVTGRLEQIIRRLGGRRGPAPLTHEQKRAYLRWLAANDPTADNPYTRGRLAPLTGAKDDELVQAVMF